MVSEMMVAVSVYIPVHTILRMGYNRKLFMRHESRTKCSRFEYLIRSPGSHNGD